jgi:1H-pyrrole-2-carbonyl-[peptidyl-carrier protein] chlorinase
VSSSSEPAFEVAIIGGGPAGAGMGAYLGRAGVKCVILESDLFPRPHVGESLVPASTRIFKELGFLDTMEEARFPRKYGAAWTTGARATPFAEHFQGLAPDCRADIRFDERPQAGVDQNYTYHVDRGKFDVLLLQHAHRLGADVYEGVRVAHVDFSSTYPQVVFRMGRKEMAIDARMVVDASGRRTLLGNQLKLKVLDPVFDQYAIHSWFGDYRRSAWNTDGRSAGRGLAHQALNDPAVASSTGHPGFEDNYIYVHFLPISNSWVWQIPITEDITSIGVVTQKKNFAKAKQSREEFFWACVDTRPGLAAALRAATRLRPFKDEGDYSYAMTQLAGDAYMLIGDAGRFVDPIFSTGVSIALNSARFGSRDILAALEKGDVRRPAFQTFEETIRRGTKTWYDFINVYYRLNVIFTAFVLDPRYRLDTLKLLQGDVYDEDEPDVLRRMRELVTYVETHPEHMWHPLLGELTQHAFSPRRASA